MIKSWLHLRYSLAFKDFTYQGRLTKLNFFHHASNWNFNLTLISSFQNVTPASLNTEAYTERRERNRLRYSLTTSMSVTLLLTVFFLWFRFPRRLMLSQWQSRDNWISLWGRSGVDHNLNKKNMTTDIWHLRAFILLLMTVIFFFVYFFGRFVLVVRFVSFRSFCFGHFGVFASFISFSCFGF